jgi:hypothetical protein
VQSQFGDSTRLARTLVDVEYKIADFPQGADHRGMYEFPFAIDLPEEVQQSVMVQLGERNASQQFFLKAQMMPTADMGMATQRADVSILRTDTPVLAFMPDSDGLLMKPNHQPQHRAPNLTHNLTMEVGGALGIGKSTSTATIWIEKARFAPGEKIRVHIDCNNSTCKKAVKSFKTKLLRKITFYTGKANDTAPLMDAQEYVVTQKYAGINANEQKEKTVEMQLPLKD